MPMLSLAFIIHTGKCSCIEAHIFYEHHWCLQHCRFNSDLFMSDHGADLIHMPMFWWLRLSVLVISEVDCLVCANLLVIESISQSYRRLSLTCKCLVIKIISLSHIRGYPSYLGHNMGWLVVKKIHILVSLLHPNSIH